MKKVAKKMKSYAGNVNIVNNDNLSLKLFRIAICAIFIFALSYSFLLGGMVFNIVKRQNLNIQAKALSNEVGNLELQYLSASSKIDKDFSAQMGFKETKAEYASRGSLTALRVTSNEL